jgi:phosphate starvation-inducible protein PhoH
VRHPLVQKIVEAYEKYDQTHGNNHGSRDGKNLYKKNK